MLEKELQYYNANQEMLVKKFDNKFIVIKEEKVLGAYKSKTEAYFETIKCNTMGEFLIEYCSSLNDHPEMNGTPIIITPVEQ